MKITESVLLQVGAKLVATPRTLSDKYTTGRPEGGKPTLVAIMQTAFGEHFKEVYSPLVLRDMKAGPNAFQCYVLTAAQIETLSKMK